MIALDALLQSVTAKFALKTRRDGLMSKRTATLVLIAGLLSIVSISVVVSTRNTNAQTPQADKPIEQTRKNIQVLHPPKTPAPPRARPSVEEIFARYLQAIGGANAGNTKTLFMKGARVASQNRNVANEITLSLPDKLLVLGTTPQGSVRQILAGDNGWVLSGTNLRTLSPTEVADARRGLQALFGIVKVTHSPGMQLAGMEKIDGRDMWVVAKSTPEKIVSYDFDTETGLLRRTRTINHTTALPIPEQIDFEDYRDVDGVKLPFIIRSSAIDTYDSWTRTFTEIKRNVAVDDSLFAQPVVPK